MSLFKNKRKKDNPPFWFDELLKVVQEHSIDEWYSYVPADEQHWIEKLPRNIESKINMRINNGSEIEYYYEFHF